MMSTLPAESPPEKICGDLSTRRGFGSQSELTKRFRNQWPIATTRTTTMAHFKSTRSIANGSTTTAATKCDNRKGLKKPLLQVGDLVYAAWWPEGTDRESQPSWYAGKITSFAEVDCSDGVDDAITYGPLRFYDVQFDDGDFLDDILDVFVFAKSDYLLSMRQTCWMGVKNKVDKNSVDDWAKIVGWYVALIEGQERSFSFLTDALRAYDASIVRQNGPKTIKSQLNLPEEWAFFDLQEKRAPINIRTIKCARTSNGSKNKGHFELVSDQLPSFESGLLKRNNEALSG